MLRLHPGGKVGSNEKLVSDYQYLQHHIPKTVILILPLGSHVSQYHYCPSTILKFHFIDHKTRDKSLLFISDHKQYNNVKTPKS